MPSRPGCRRPPSRVGSPPMALEGETADDVPVTVWAPEGTEGQALPLLLVNDGPEYDQLASITQFCGAKIASGEPACRTGWRSPTR